MHLFRICYFAIFVAAAVDVSCLVARGDDPRDVFAAMREKRESLRTYSARVHFGDASNGMVKLTGDYLTGSHRCEFGEDGNKTAVLHSDKMFLAYERNEPMSVVSIDFPRPDELGMSPLIDLRAVGISNSADNNEIDGLDRIWQHNISHGTPSILSESDGVVRIAVESNDGDETRSIPKLKVFEIDVNRGYSLKRMDGFLGISTSMLKSDPSLARGSAHYQSIVTNWEEHGGEWVPVESVVTLRPDTDSPRSTSIRIEWEGVNDSIDAKLFTYASLGSSGSPVYDDRVDPPVLVEYLPYASEETIALQSSIEGSAWLRWPLIAAGVVFALLAIFGAFRVRPTGASTKKP